MEHWNSKEPAVSLVSHRQECSSSSDPVFGLDLRWHIQEKYEVSGVTCGTQLTSSGTRLVQWTWVTALFDVLVDSYWLEPNQRECDDWLSWKTVLEAELVGLPSGAFDEQSMHVDTILWHLLDVVRSVVSDVRLELECIDRRLRLSRIGLQRGSHETLREEE